MQAQTPEAVIRAYLAEHEGREQVSVRELMATWGYEGCTQQEQERVSAALAQAGVQTDRPLGQLAVDDRITVSISDDDTTPDSSAVEVAAQDDTAVQPAAPWRTGPADLVEPSPPDSSGGPGGASMAPPPRSDGRFTEFLRRHPRRSFWATLVVALIVGAALGAAGSSQQDEIDRLDDRLATTRSDLQDARDENETLQGDLDQANSTVERLTAKGEVPDLTGGTVADAEDAVADYDWNLKVSREPTDEVEPGIVISQSPPEGTVLKAGRSLALTVARKPPPSWKTIFSFSGSGSRKSDEFTVPSGLKTRISYTFSGNTNAILEIGVPGDEFGGELLLNEIGDYSDTTRVYNQAGRRFLDVEGGSWTVEVQVFK
jgi:hypothetical protein